MANSRAHKPRIERIRSLQFKDSFVDHIEMQASTEYLILTHGQMFPSQTDSKTDQEILELLIEGRLRIPIRVAKRLKDLLETILNDIPEDKQK